jgi:hypothetical protein
MTAKDEQIKENDVPERIQVNVLFLDPILIWFVRYI